MGVRSAKKLKGALMLLRTMYVLEFIRDMIRDSKSSTLREMYYISEGWDIAKFHAQEESNLLAEDLEVITQLLREDFKLRPEESGASVIGNLTLEEITRNGDRKRINCRDDVGGAGYTIPYHVEKQKVNLIEADAKFILAIETGGMFDRLVAHGFDADATRVSARLTGQPRRSPSQSPHRTTPRTHTRRASSGPSASCDRRPQGDLSKTEPKVPSIHIVRPRPAPFERTSNRHIGSRTSSGSVSVGFAPSVVRTMSCACDGPTFATGIASLTVSAARRSRVDFAASGPSRTASLRGISSNVRRPYTAWPSSPVIAFT